MPLSKEVCTTYVDHIGVASFFFIFSVSTSPVSHHFPEFLAHNFGRKCILSSDNIFYDKFNLSKCKNLERKVIGTPINQFCYVYTISRENCSECQHFNVRAHLFNGPFQLVYDYFALRKANNTSSQWHCYDLNIFDGFLVIFLQNVVRLPVRTVYHNH